MNIKTTFLFILLSHSLYAMEKVEDISPGERILYVKKGVPALATIKEKKIFGFVTSFLPLIVGGASFIGIWSNTLESILDTDDRINDNNKMEIKIFFSILAAGVTVLTSLIPVHYFMQAQVEEEQYFLLKNKGSLKEEAKSFVRKYANKVSTYLSE
jgi:hypothetical protein